MASTNDNSEDILFRAQLAQWTEQQPSKLLVAGSNPVLGASIVEELKHLILFQQLYIEYISRVFGIPVQYFQDLPILNLEENDGIKE